MIKNLEREIRAEMKEVFLVEWQVDTIMKKVHEVIAAFDGCTKCFGKGYGTQTLAIRSKRFTQKAPTVVFCVCSRGQQLQENFRPL